ncbi:MAG: hypothetical protein J5621_00985 [Paludibacteraceae bacterium]|nr:hypothetical protein [Paludibacteraceae bacterium]
MSQVEFYSPVKSMSGKLEKGSDIVMRKKKYRAPNGAVLKVGVQESYKIVNPRDYKKNPPKGKELENITIFTDTKRLSSEIIRAGKLTDDELAAMPQEQRTHILDLRKQLEDFRRRFYAQFKRPDPEAPFQKKPEPGSSVLRRKQYSKLDNFIQAILRENLKNNL